MRLQIQAKTGKNTRTTITWRKSMPLSKLNRRANARIQPLAFSFPRVKKTRDISRVFYFCVGPRPVCACARLSFAAAKFWRVNLREGLH
jgi:hypothetical protein